MNEVKVTVPEGLKKCPFCGADVEIVCVECETRTAGAPWTAKIECTGCTERITDSKFHDTKTDAAREMANRWNTRYVEYSTSSHLGENLTPKQRDAARNVITRLLTDTRKGILPGNAEEFTRRLATQKEMLTPLDRDSLYRMAVFCLHGVMLLADHERNRGLMPKIGT